MVLLRLSLYETYLDRNHFIMVVVYNLIAIEISSIFQEISACTVQKYHVSWKVGRTAQQLQQCHRKVKVTKEVEMITGIEELMRSRRMVQIRNRSERVPVTYHICTTADVQICISCIGSVELILNSFFHTKDGTVGGKWSLYETAVRSETI